eukprot:CAMPEP_0197905492 /NCGR_PEP_ID=MMETSP1439-20131203/60447_1 /TAXON_ID=66791 /ORGANISM="Gonyaulax spinifera, Strain CCMP409" /LENGTH=149 /DNA_ID=CAMNT_0043526773 /DNA_START=142 /DNA_END=590 /DNA_ORIENTATION=+
MARTAPITESFEAEFTLSLHLSVLQQNCLVSHTSPPSRRTPSVVQLVPTHAESTGAGETASLGLPIVFAATALVAVRPEARVAIEVVAGLVAASRTGLDASRGAARGRGAVGLVAGDGDLASFTLVIRWAVTEALQLRGAACHVGSNDE